jgi:hypothetical protein
VPTRRPSRVSAHVTLALAFLLAAIPVAAGASSTDVASRGRPVRAAAARRVEALPSRMVRLTLRIGGRCTETTAPLRLRRSALVYP